MSLLFNCQLSESGVMGITQITQRNRAMIKFMDIAQKSVQSINPFKSPDYLGTGVVQTINDIVKAHGDVMNVSRQAGKGTTFLLFISTRTTNS